MEQGCLTYFPQYKVDVSSGVFSGEEADNAEAEASGPRERHHRQLRAHLQAKLQNQSHYIHNIHSRPGEFKIRRTEDLDLSKIL